MIYENYMGSIAKIGLKDASFSLEVLVADSTRIVTLSGSPDIAAAVPCDNIVTCKLKDVMETADNLFFEQSVTFVTDYNLINCVIFLYNV